MTIIFEAFAAPIEADVAIPGLLATVSAYKGKLCAIPGALATPVVTAHTVVSVAISGELATVVSHHGTYGYVRGLLAEAYGAGFDTPPFAVGFLHGASPTISGGGHCDRHTSVDILGAGVTVSAYRGRLGIIDGLLARASGNNFEPLAHSILIAFQSPGYMSMSGGPGMEWLTSSINLTSSYTVAQVTTVLETLHLHDSRSSHLAARSNVVDHIVLRDFLHLVWNNLVSDGFVLHSTATPSAKAVQNVVESLVLTAGPGHLLHAINAVASAIVMHDVTYRAQSGSVTETLNLTSSYDARLAAANALVESLVLHGTAAPSAHLMVAVSEDFVLHDTPAAQLTALINVLDTLDVAVTVTLNGEAFLAWVINTTNTAVSTYTNFPFNSFAEIPKGTYNACNESGIYVLDGNDDDGDKIQARIRTGLWNMGTGLKKRVPDCYIGYTSDGTLVMKVVTTEQRVKVENWYKMALRPSTDTSGARIKFGRGLKSVYYAFELHNVDGSNFSIDNLSLRPLVLERRI